MEGGCEREELREIGRRVPQAREKMGDIKTLATSQARLKLSFVADCSVLYRLLYAKTDQGEECF